MFCLDKQWIILIPVLLHFLDFSVSSHLLPSSFLLNSTFAQTCRENGSTIPQHQLTISPVYLAKMVPEIYYFKQFDNSNNSANFCISLLSRTLKITHTRYRNTKYKRMMPAFDFCLMKVSTFYFYFYSQGKMEMQSRLF